ncbi:ATP-binding protein [bacterium]|nr:ATP-binding protein [bacterium]
MEMQALRRLVREGEHHYLEFKRKANHPERIAREVVAFANAEGGTLLIGVDDDGEIYGTKTPEEDAFELTQIFSQIIVPPMAFSLDHIPVDSKRRVLAFSIKESSEKPHFVKDDIKKTAYVRVRDMSVQASREMRRLMWFRSRINKGVKFEFGDQEQSLLRHLEENTPITLTDAQRVLSVSRRKTSDLLVTLVRAGLLNISPNEKEDHYSLKKGAFT